MFIQHVKNYIAELLATESLMEKKINQCVEVWETGEYLLSLSLVDTGMEDLFNEISQN